jgi:hypothetical protein
MRIYICNELGAAGGHVEDLTFVAAYVAVECDPRTMIARLAPISTSLFADEHASSVVIKV